MKSNAAIRYAAALSLREREACYAELEPLDNGWRLAEAETFALPEGGMSGGHIVDGALLGSSLGAQLDYCWKKAPLIVGIPTTECFYQLLTLPTASVREAREAVRWNFSRYFPFAYEDALFDVCEAELPVPASSGMTVTAVAARKKELMSLCDALRSPSSHVSAVEPVGVACARAVLPPSVYDKGGSVLLTVQCGGSVQFSFVNDDTGLMFRSVFLDETTASRSDALKTVREEFSKTLDYVQERFFCTPSLLVAGPDDLCAALSGAAGGRMMARTAVSKLHCLELGALEGSDWFDVAGLLLRYADADQV